MSYFSISSSGLFARAVQDYEVYLRDKYETPMSFAYNASVLLRIIRQNEYNISLFVPTDELGTEFSHTGQLINLAMIKNMVEGQLDTYLRTVRKKAFFGHEIPSELFPEIQIERLVDDVRCRTMGYSFIDDPRNNFGAHKASYAKWLLSDEVRRNRFTYHNGKDIVWKPKEAIELLKAFQAIELELAPGLIFSSGPSSRGTEFGHHLLREIPGCLRSLGIVLHNVSLNATTDKSSHQRLLDRYVPHIPTREWAAALLGYLVVFRPFIEYLVEQIFKDNEVILKRYYFYLWPGISNTMTSHDLSEKMGQITQKYLGRGYGIKFWRSLTTTILQFLPDDEVNETNRQYYFDTANMHSTKTANSKYGGNTGNMLGADSRVIAGCVRVGLAWHKRIGIGQKNPLRLGFNTTIGDTTAKTENRVALESTLEQIKSFRDESMSSIKASVSETMAELSRVYFPPPPSPHTSLPLVSDIEVHPSRLTAFREFVGDPNAQWSCPQQAIFVEHLIQGRENVLGILGTGFGKTTAVMFVAKAFSGGKSTVVVMPLAALHEDFHNRARSYGLKASRWSQRGKFDANAHIITAAIEDLMHEDFVK